MRIDALLFWVFVSPTISTIKKSQDKTGIVTCFSIWKLRRVVRIIVFDDGN